MRGSDPDAALSIYKQAVAVKCRSQAPVAGASLDRTALRKFNDAMAGNKVEALVCFSCGGIHPYVEEVEAQGDIRWRQLLERDAASGQLSFLGQPLEKIRELLGLQVYLDRYNKVGSRPLEETAEDAPKLTDREDFRHWTAKLPGPAGGALLCCPEDWAEAAIGASSPDQDCVCERCPQNAPEKTLCEACRAPVCGDCAAHLERGRLPPLSYANDMWTGYGLERIYKEQVTAIELVCAAPYLTSMILMSMENRRKRGAEDPSVFDEKAHMARHRFGARGNVITFPLPMEELLQKLREPNPEHDDLSVPRSGHQLAQMFRVILKTNKHGRSTEEELKTLIHQATVRREARASARLGSSRFLARWW